MVKHSVLISMQCTSDLRASGTASTKLLHYTIPQPNSSCGNLPEGQYDSQSWNSSSLALQASSAETHTGYSTDRHVQGERFAGGLRVKGFSRGLPSAGSGDPSPPELKLEHPPRPWPVVSFPGNHNNCSMIDTCAFILFSYL